MITNKKYSELTDEEKAILIFPYGNTKKDYINYHVRYNKQGKLLGVKPNHFTKEYSEKLDEESLKPDILDYCTLMGKNQQSKQYKTAYRKMTAYARKHNI